MPTTDPIKNLEYVKKSQMKKKETLGADAYNKINADIEQKHRDKLKATIGIDEYKKQQAEYMKQYRATKKALKLDVEKKQNSVNTIADAIKARRARKEMQTLAIEQANKTADKLEEIGKTAKELINTGKNIKKSHKKKRGKKSKSK
jgi:hypothetical protein